MNFSGENISLSDALFVDNVTGDLESWRIQSEAITRALVFPPVNNYHRFLIHKVRFTAWIVHCSVPTTIVIIISKCSI